MPATTPVDVKAAIKVARNLKKRLYIALSILLLTVTTPFAIMQVLGKQLPFYLIDHPTLFFSAFTFPQSGNSAYIDGNIRAIALGGGGELWIGGDGGLLAKSNTPSTPWDCLALSGDTWQSASCTDTSTQAAPTVLAIEWFDQSAAALVASNSAIYSTTDTGATWNRVKDLVGFFGILQTNFHHGPTVASIPIDITVDGVATFTAPEIPADCATTISVFERANRSFDDPVPAEFGGPPFGYFRHYQLSPSCIARPYVMNSVYHVDYYYLLPNDPHSIWFAGINSPGGAIRNTAPSRPIIPTIHLPAPWYFVALFFTGVLLYRASKAKVKTETLMADTIANLGVSDRPLNWGDDDAMGFHAMARGISLFLRNINTGLPLVLAVNGAWGSGKSSLMNLLWTNMEASTRMVWFNAWHHQSEEQLLAALLQAVRVQSLEDVWSRRGMGRRLQMLGAQLGKNWPITTLLSFVVIALVMLIVHIILYLSSGDVGASHLTTQVRAWTALITGIIALGGTLKKLKTSIGSLIANPASLLTSYKASVTIDDLNAQTTFRQRFSNDFKKLITVLGDRRLVILIDDLDRCRPETIREVTEAINFLVTSGECAIILGLARPYVEQFLGVAFKDFVEGMPPELIGLDPKKTWTDAQLDRTYAELYLEKLIQIDITIPKPTDAQASAIVVPQASSVPAAPLPKDKVAKDIAERIVKRRNLEASLRSLFRMLDRWAGPLLGALVLGSLLTYALVDYHNPIYRRVDRMLFSQETEPALVKPQTTVPGAGTGKSNTSDGLAHKVMPKQPQLVVTPSTLSAPPLSYVTYPTALPAWLIVAAMTLVLLIFLAVLLRIMLTSVESLTVNDSPAFQRALRAWIPLIHSVFNSPRSLKRYMNKVRFLAMRQRALTEADPVSPVDRWASSVAQRIYSTLPGEPELVTATPAPAAEPIPDNILIVLVAVEGDEILWKMLRNHSELKALEDLDESERLWFKAKDTAIFASLKDVWPHLRQCLLNYIQLSGNITAT